MEFTRWEEAVQWLMDQPDQQDLVRACYYDLPRRDAAARYWQSDEWQAVRALSPAPSGKALDIGAGHGITSYALARDGWQVVSLEPDPSQLIGAGAIGQLASAEKLPIEVVQASGERLPFAEGVFQFVLARQTLHHARDLPSLCTEAFRVLSPGGIFVALREHVLSRPSDLTKFLNGHPLHRLYGGENAFVLSDYTSALESSGFIIRKILRSLDSVINYAPRSEGMLQEEISRRIGKVPLGGKLFQFLFPGREGFVNFLKYLSLFDRRPGRLFSFICQKP